MLSPPKTSKRKSNRLAEKEARAAIVRNDVLSDPDLRDHILNLAIFTSPYFVSRDTALLTGKVSKFKIWGRLACVCKEWATAVRSTPDIARTILQSPLSIGMAEVRTLATFSVGCPSSTHPSPP